MGDVMKKIYQVECNDEININKWLKENPDIEVEDIKVCMNNIGELITVIYKIQIEEAEE